MADPTSTCNSRPSTPREKEDAKVNQKGPVTMMSSAAHGSDTRTHKLFGDVQLLLIDPAGRALFGLRRNTGLKDGEYNLPAGHMEAGESAIQAAIREAREELGIVIAPEDVEFAHVMHSPLSGGRASFFFRIRQWKGIPANREPQKCSELHWFHLDRLPKAVVSYCRAGLEQIADGSPFSVCGWESQPQTRRVAGLPTKRRKGTRTPAPKSAFAHCTAA